MKRTLVGLCLYLFLITAVPNAQGEQLATFDLTPTSGNPTFTAPYHSNFYSFSADSYQIIDSPALCGCASNGTQYFATSFAMTMTDGGLSTLLNFDAAQLYSPGDARNATSIVVVGKKVISSLPPVTVSFSLPTDGSFMTFVLPAGFNTLQDAEFYGVGADGTNTSFAIDNIHTVDAPEPISLTLFLSGLGGLIFVVRRQRHHA